MDYAIWLRNYPHVRAQVNFQREGYEDNMNNNKINIFLKSEVYFQRLSFTYKYFIVNCDNSDVHQPKTKFLSYFKNTLQYFKCLCVNGCQSYIDCFVLLLCGSEIESESTVVSILYETRLCQRHSVFNPYAFDAQTNAVYDLTCFESHLIQKLTAKKDPGKFL